MRHCVSTRKVLTEYCMQARKIPILIMMNCCPPPGRRFKYNQSTTKGLGYVFEGQCSVEGSVLISDAGMVDMEETGASSILLRASPCYEPSQHSGRGEPTAPAVE